jgi:hypothetical protein
MNDLIPPEQWIEIVGAIGYDESADPAIFAAIERGAQLAIADELARIAVCIDGGADPLDAWAKAEAAGRRDVRARLYERARELRGEQP